VRCFRQLRELSGANATSKRKALCGVFFYMTDAILRHAIGGGKDSGISLAFDFDRTPPVLSIQMYSAIADPFWSSFMYFNSCASH